MRKIPAIIVLPLLLASVALGQTSLFACSFTDHKVYEYTTAGVFVKAYERPGTPQFAPRDAVLSTDGVLYVANANGSIDAFSTTTAALLRSYDVQAVNNPLALAAGADGKLYISGGRTYGRLDAGTGHLDILFLKPDESFGIALRPDNGNLLLSNYPTPTTNAGSVLEYSLATSPPTLIGTFVPSLSVPAGMEFGPDGRLFISDLDLGKVFVAPATGGSPAVFASQNMNSPRDVTFDGLGSMWVANDDGTRRYSDSTGAFLSWIPGNGITGLTSRAVFVAVPEPASWVGLTIAGVCAVRRRRRR